VPCPFRQLVDPGLLVRYGWPYCEERKSSMKMIAFCGLDCAACPARTAYMNDDDDLRERTAGEWSRLYGADIPPKSINCTGCTGEGLKFHHCEHGCEIRKCALPRGVSHCGECALYPCPSIAGFLEMVPEARANLEG
jgi:hypothetical protein